MTNAVRSNTRAVATVEPPAPSMTERAKTKELAALTKPEARRLIESMLPTGVTIERIFAETYFAIQKNPELQNCTDASLVMAVAQCTRWDLEIGVLAHLVPFKTKVKNGNGEWEWETRCQAVRDYKGDATMAIRAGAARFIDAQAVHEGDEFEYELGSSPFVRHRPAGMGKRGKLIGFYAVAKISRDDVRVFVMSRDEVDQVRMQYSKSWKEHWVNNSKVPYTLDEIPWYGLKTCVHRICKLLPTTPKLAEVLRAFEAEEVAALEEIDAPNALATGGEQRQLSAPRSELPAEVTEAAGSASYELTNRSLPAKATPEQKARITQLLDSADVDDATRERVAGAAGRKDYAAADAESQIAELEKLVPAGEFGPTGEG
jgi:phage RecT family recombinase